MDVTTHIKTSTSSLWSVFDYTQELYPYLKKLPLVERPPIKIYGRECRQARDVGFFSNESIGYNYSNQIILSTKFDNYPWLLELMIKVNGSLGSKFNGLLINRYRNGNDYISAHSDDESGLDPNLKIVAGIAYGPKDGERIFRIRKKTSEKTTNPIELDIINNSKMLLVMQGDFQKEFTHEIPKQTKVKGERYSVTFRHHVE